jgi:hypothetical protein|tara:strand:+ start:5388 stop:5720 length:333 start_codon:yes stop_codon:yes gene_type:complete
MLVNIINRYGINSIVLTLLAALIASIGLLIFIRFYKKRGGRALINNSFWRTKKAEPRIIKARKVDAKPVKSNPDLLEADKVALEELLNGKWITKKQYKQKLDKLKVQHKV